MAKTYFMSCSKLASSENVTKLVRNLLLAHLMGQYCFARWRLSSSVIVCNAAGRQVRGQSSCQRSTAGQYGYVPLGRHLISLTVPKESTT